MDIERFKFLLEFVSSELVPKGPCRPDAISPVMKLMVTLRFLAGGESFQTLALCFRIAHNTISTIIQQTCDAIIVKVGPKYMITPNTAEEWHEIRVRFLRDWNFPGVVGCLDGKHIAVVKPSSTGSQFLNYKSELNFLNFAGFFKF